MEEILYGDKPQVLGGYNQVIGNRGSAGEVGYIRQRADAVINHAARARRIEQRGGNAGAINYEPVIFIVGDLCTSEP